ncbi:CsbD family protein [Chamaesiphon sp. VAR_48_metabat_403]|uniref:CsbD family protein n=1 Tax=Chamaesiphon sp. VAR_48_metabat_403 TaxID=2964700 RepID=UPI00286E50DB|nr:CsbD family protein [Chamaesiphon sp. VAR_48_metabat_403]
MSIEERAKAAAQNVEGKGQEVVGKVTGSNDDEAAGKAKQAAAKVRDGVEDAKDKVAEAAQDLGDKIRDGVDNAKREMNK